MSLIQLLAKLISRNDAESNWEGVNPVLDKGEFGVVPEYPPLVKIGDGSQPWSALPFYTNHYNTNLDYNSDIQEPFNPIHLTTYIFLRLNKEVTDLVFLMDSFRDVNLNFCQCDGRVHKIVIANIEDYPLYVEAWLSSNEQNEGSIIRDFGTATINPGSYGLIEYFWVEDKKKICICRFTSL